MHSRATLKGESALADWQALFDSIQSRGGISDGSSRMVGPDQAVFRAMYLDLSTVREEFRAQSAPAAVTICADVLNIPHRFDWVLPGTKLVIVARRIQSAGYATLTLDYRDSRTASLTVFTEEVDGRFQAIAVTAPDGPQPAAFIFDTAPATGGVRIDLPVREPVETLVTSMRDLPPHSRVIVEQALRTELAVASLLRDQRPDVARAMIGWIRSCSDGMPGMGRMTAELDQLMAAQLGAACASLFPRPANSLAAIG
jgi:hypothetical protein